MAVLPILGTDTSPYPEVIDGAPKPLAASAATAVAPVKKAPSPLGFVQDKTAAAPVQTPTPPRTDFQNRAVAGYYGLQSAGSVTPTPSAGEAVVGIAGATASGAAMGASVAGPYGAVVGAGVGLVMGSLNAYMGVQSARKARNKEEALKNDYNRKAKEEIARDEKWRVQNRLDTLEEARYQRKKFAMQQAYEATQVQGKNMMALISNNAALKEKYAKYGFV